jgi:hypothetical protein
MFRIVAFGARYGRAEICRTSFFAVGQPTPLA